MKRIKKEELTPQLKARFSQWEDQKYMDFGPCCFCNLGSFSATEAIIYKAPKTGELLRVDYDPIFGECTCCGAI